MVDCSFQRLIIHSLFSISVFDSDLQRRQRVERVLIASFACLTSFSLLLAFWIVSDSMVDCSFKRPCLSLLSMLSFFIVHLTLTFVPLQRRQRGRVRESIDSEVKIMTSRGEIQRVTNFKTGGLSGGHSGGHFSRSDLLFPGGWTSCPQGYQSVG